MWACPLLGAHHHTGAGGWLPQTSELGWRTTGCLLFNLTQQTLWVLCRQDRFQDGTSSGSYLCLGQHYLPLPLPPWVTHTAGPHFLCNSSLPTHTTSGVPGLHLPTRHSKLPLYSCFYLHAPHMCHAHALPHHFFPASTLPPVPHPATLLPSLPWPPRADGCRSAL